MAAHQLGRVLIIGVQHDDDVRTQAESRVVAGLLIATVAPIGVVLNRVLDAQRLGERQRVVGASVVDEHDIVDDVDRNLAIGPFQRPRRVVGRQNHDNLVTEQHRRMRTLL